MSEISKSDVRNLVIAMRDAFIAINDEEAARNAYDGFEWDYYGIDYADKVDASIEEVSGILAEILSSS